MKPALSRCFFEACRRVIASGQVGGRRFDGVPPQRRSSSLRAAAPEGVPGGVGRLSDIAKVPLLMKESSARVREVWLERFRENERVVAGVIADREYELLCASAAACPMFLVPVPRGSGYINLVWQAQGRRFIYQTLDSFQKGGGSSVGADLGVVLFPELLSTHHLALLHGELHTPVLTKAEAERVVRYTREAYSDSSRFAWVKKFNCNPREFDYEAFMKEFKPLEWWQSVAE